MCQVKLYTSLTKKSLYQTALSTGHCQKTSFAFILLKFLEFALSPRLHPQPDHIINTQLDLSWDHFKSSLQGKLTMIFYLKYLPHWIWTHRHNQPILSGVSESSTYPLQNWAYFFPLTSRLGSFAPLLLSLDWSQVTHMLASKKNKQDLWGWTTFYNLCQRAGWRHVPAFQDGSQPFHHAHKHSSQVVKHHIQQAKNFEDSVFKVLPSHVKVLPGHYKEPHTTSKGHAPLLILVATMEQS